MRKISLLPPDFKQAQRIRRKRLLFFSTGVMLMLIFLVVNGFFLYLAREIEAEQALVQQHQRLVQQEIQALQRYVHLQEQAEQLEDLLRQALGKEPAWEQVLEKLSFSAPLDVRFSRLQITSNQDRGHLNIRAEATDYYSLGQWMETMENLPFLENVSLRILQGPEGYESGRVHFEITAELLPETTAFR